MDREESDREAKVLERRERARGKRDVGQDTQHEARRQSRSNDWAFQVDFVSASKGHGFSVSINRTLKKNEIITAHKLWSRMNTPEKAAFLANRRQGVGATWAGALLERGMLDGERKTAVRRRLCLRVEECRICECGALKDERGDHTLACQKIPWTKTIHDRVRDSVARQLRRMGATAGLERVARLWSKQFTDKHVTDKIRVARIDVVATVLGRDELEWLDMAIRRPTAVPNALRERQDSAASSPPRERKKHERTW